MNNSLQVGRRYKSRVHNQAIVIIKKENGCFLGNNGIKYNPQGVATEKGASWDLVYQDEDGVYKMLHALGISYSKSKKEVQPYKNYRPKLVSERNHYQIWYDEDWEELIKLGYATKGIFLNLNCYFVTSKGIEELKRLGYIFEVRNKR